jgi:Sulfotransferase family
MLLSHRHRFLFVHIYKTAGISISTALIPYAATEGQLRLDRRFNRLGLSFLYPRVIRRDSSVRDWVSNVMNNVFERLTFLDEHPQPVRDPHATASEIISTIGRERFDSCYSFGIVRNPWDWQVSLYRFALETVMSLPRTAAYVRGLAPERRTYSGLKSFDDYIRWRCAEDVHLQKEFLFSDDGEQLVTFIGKYERLDEDFREICSAIGIDASLPRLNESAAHTRYQEYYTPETIELVREAFADDIEVFGYEFD